MKTTGLALMIVAAMGLSACSSTKPVGMTPASDTNVAVKDRTVAAHFKDQGIELHYTMFGKLEKVYVWGVAPAWKGMDQMKIIAETDAKLKLVKFVHGETGESNQRVQIIGRSLDKARDNTLNRFDSNTSKAADFSFDAAQIEKEIQRNPMPADESNTSRRIAQSIDNTLVNQTQSLRSQGRLSGVIKVDNGVSKDGKWYFAKYEWSKQTQAARTFILENMR